MKKRRYLCSLCQRPRIPSHGDPEVLLCGRCDLVQVPTMTEEPERVQDEQ